MSDYQIDVQETDLISNDSENECSQSVCSDTHSDTTSASGFTDKSTLSESTIHALSGGSEGENSASHSVTAIGLDAKPNFTVAINRGIVLPWGAQKERTVLSGQHLEMDLRPGEFVMRNLFADFTVIAEKKIEFVMTESHEKPLSKSLQRGEDSQFDQLLSAFGSVAEHCLPSLLRALFSWYERQMSEVSNPEQKKSDIKQKSIINIVAGNTTETVERSEADIQKEKRDLAVEFIFCLVLIEVLKQMGLHPGHEDLVQYIENLALKHFKHHEGIQNNPNSANIHMISDLYAEVIGVLAQSRFMSVRTRFMAELKELRSRETSPNTTQSIISLLMGMKFFRVKMVPIEEFEASFQFMQECAQYFLEVKDKDIKHALAGLFVEILVPVAAAVKNEVNVPCLKNFVEMLYTQTLDASTKSKHRLALFPLVTCLLCVSQKQFFLQNWHYFLAMCLSHLKNRDPKMCRVALESLYRLLWVYMIRIKCESNSATQSRLQSIVNSLFPKGSKGVVPRETPLNIFVKIIQFIAQERLDFAMREIVFDLLSVARPFKVILTPERMSIGLRAFLVVADSLQQKEGDPPMPRSVGVLPSGNTLRVRKTFLNKMLTEDTARSIGMNAYFPHVRRVFVDILRALDTQYGRPLMMTNTQNVNKEPDEMITGERKPRIELFRTCVAAVPRLIPDGMTSGELVDLLSRLTVHMDEELRGLSYCSLQSLVVDFPDWRQDVLWGLTQFVAKEVLDTFPQLMDHGLKMILTLLCAWKTAVSGANMSAFNSSTLRAKEYNELKVGPPDPNLTKRTDTSKSEPLASVLHYVEALALVMLCTYRLSTRRLSVMILKEVKSLLKVLNCSENPPVIDIMDQYCPQVVEKCLPLLPPAEKTAIQAVGLIGAVDLQWLADRSSSVWTVGLFEDGSVKNAANYNFSVTDPWSICYFGFLETDRLLSSCTLMAMHSWPIVFTRLNALYSVVDPTPLNDNRASLLRSATAVKKPPTERDAYMHLWKNYITFAFRVVPLISNPIIRCASPDLSLSSSPDSLNAEKNDSSKLPATNISPSSLYKLVVPHLRCEVADIRDAAVFALGNINGTALRDLFEELTVYIRESIDKKQENVRRRRRRDALRLQLMRLLEYIGDNGTFGISSCVLDRDSQSLTPILVEFVDGVRYYLENEPDKNSNAVRDLTLHFCYFIRKLVKNFTLDACRSLLKRDLRCSLFTLFGNWAGKYGFPIGKTNLEGDVNNKKHQELQLIALQAMSSLLCCGPCFDCLTEESPYYLWIDGLLNSLDEKVYSLAQETVILLLESNPDVSPLLDWVVDKCYTGTSKVADSCFIALATIFSAREYPCDHYTAIINVTLMNTGCPRQEVRDTALQLLQLLDKRFFGCIGPLVENDLAEGDKGRSTLDVILATTYCRSQIHLSRQLALLHPELTMPMFSEITYRFQTARPEVRQLLLQYLLPWLHNMELVDPNIPPTNTHMYQFYTGELNAERKEGWGSAEATEMVLNNIFYITAKFGDNHPKEIEETWATLCTSWPNNMKVIIRYLIIVSGMAPCELLPYAKRVVLYLARVQSARLLDEMMIELQTVETLNCLIERTETPPFYRLTVMRKASSHSDGANGVAGQTDSSSRNDLSIEKGTIHTKRHSGEDPSKTSIMKSDSGSNIFSDFAMTRPEKKCQEEMISSLEEVAIEEDVLLRDKTNMSVSQPHPLPMPEFGGYFAPLTEYLPDSSQPISGFHRCNVGVMLLCDIVVDGIELDWTVHVPLMLHILFLGLDHTRPLVHQHCKQLLLNLLIVLAVHNDHLTVAHILLNCKTKQLELGLTTPTLNNVVEHTFTESNPTINEFLLHQIGHGNNIEATNKSISQAATNIKTEEILEEKDISIPQVVVVPENVEPVPMTKVELTVSVIIKSLIQFLASRQNSPLWNYEDITAKVWSIKSVEQIDIFMQYVLKVFRESLPNAHINERWAQTALQLGLSCSSRHYAGRSLQIFRALRVPITSRMLSDILSRLVETVAEQGEDMQGYVTELLLTLEAAVESLESDFRPLDFMKDFFKSTPNLNNKEAMPVRRNAEGSPINLAATPVFYSPIIGHARSTSYSVSYGFRKNTQSTTDVKERNRHSNDLDHRKFSPNNLSRSRSAQSLKMLGDTATQDDKLTILAQLFWLAVSLLESDYEHEFLLAVRLLASVMHRLPLDRPDARDKVEKLQSQLRWNSFPGVHALLLKGCTHQNIYEPVTALLSHFTPLLNFVVVDPSQSIAFPMNVIALLPYMLLNYEDANELCIRAAENIAQVSIEKSKKLENLGTVMNLYSRRTFSKESFQWTKCVVKYLHDTYSHLSLNMLSFLIEVLEKGPNNLQLPILNIIHCILHYVDLASAAAQPVNADLLKIIVKYIEGTNWKESLKILKLVVSRSSSLVAPPITIHSHWESSPMPHPSFNEDSIFSKKELPGRTMEFTFDMSQTPVIGRRFLSKSEEHSTSKISSTPRRSCSISPADTSPPSGWKRPWMSQGRVRECLVNLLTTCGQRVGLPKSPSVIFSQTSDIIERQSSMASSTEEVSVGNNDMSGGSRRDDAATEFGVFKDFDFLEYESESIEGESTDNFNWGVRRRPLSQGEDDQTNLKQLEDSVSEKTPVLTVRKVHVCPFDHNRLLTEESSDEEVGSESPLDEIAIAPEFDNSIENGAIFPPSSLALRENNSQVQSSARSDTSGSSTGDLGEVTPCNASPNLSSLMNLRPIISKSDILDNWTSYIQLNMLQTPANALQFFHQFQKLLTDICSSSIEITKESCSYMSQSAVSGLPTIKLISSRLMSMVDIVSYRVMVTNLIWFNTSAISNSRFIETLKYGMLEVQEHLETFCDKREQASMYCDSVKTTLKLERLSGQQSDFHHEQYLLDLGKALYKLYFQLLLLVEAGNKMISTLHNILKSADFKDVTPDVLSIKHALTRAYEDTDADGGISSVIVGCVSSENLLLNLCRLIENEKWTSVILYFKCNKEEFVKEFYELCEKENDVISILNIYCRKLVHDKPEYFVISNQDSDMSDVFGRLFQVSAAVSDLEGTLKEQPGKSTDTISK
ncbi:protein furry isoform X1 [Diorhabda carinulata]|uniref:protein furry isoform X1 n=1 Tax=Diorhabda carinulata TaxID=1163345 RepID=UPI0025A1623D|nr:protein furry isoform X1 [Diorhabda carinulata]